MATYASRFEQVLLLQESRLKMTAFLWIGVFRLSWWTFDIFDRLVTSDHIRLLSITFRWIGNSSAIHEWYPGYLYVSHTSPTCCEGVIDCRDVSMWTFKWLSFDAASGARSKVQKKVRQKHVFTFSHWHDIHWYSSTDSVVCRCRSLSQRLCLYWIGFFFSLYWCNHLKMEHVYVCLWHVHGVTRSNQREIVLLQSSNRREHDTNHLYSVHCFVMKV